MAKMYVSSCTRCVSTCLWVNYLQKEEETADSSSSESEDEDFSEMELTRQRNIHRNSLAWDEITKVFLILVHL